MPVLVSTFKPGFGDHRLHRRARHRPQAQPDVALSAEYSIDTASGSIQGPQHVRPMLQDYQFIHHQVVHRSAVFFGTLDGVEQRLHADLQSKRDTLP
jgi:hypothetical protein